jgi:hypothetical protein
MSRADQPIVRRRFLQLAGAGSALGLLPMSGAMAAASTRSRQQASTLTVKSVRPDQALNEQWMGYGNTSGLGGWAGSDGTYSTVLPGGRVAWMFNDTFLGPVNADEGLPANAGFIHNSIVVDDRGRLTTVTGGTPQSPESLVGPTPNPPTPYLPDASPYWYWNNDGIVDGGRLRLFEAKILLTDAAPPWNFTWSGEMDIASFSLPSLRLESLTRTYSEDGINWGVQFLQIGGWIYIYGSLNGLRVARARAGHLIERDWQFYTGSGWSDDPTESTVILDGIGTCGVTPVLGQFVVTETPGLLDPTIYASFGPSPVGPFTAPAAIYVPPEAANGLYTYNVAAHPEASRSPDRLVISYNVNSPVLQDLYDNINNNRPRFLELEFQA